MATDETDALVACGVLSPGQVEPRTLQAALVAVFLLLTELNRRTKPWRRSLAPVAGRFWPLCAPTRRPLRYETKEWVSTILDVLPPRSAGEPEPQQPKLAELPSQRHYHNHSHTCRASPVCWTCGLPSCCVWWACIHEPIIYIYILKACAGKTSTVAAPRPLLAPHLPLTSLRLFGGLLLCLHVCGLPAGCGASAPCSLRF